MTEKQVEILFSDVLTILEDIKKSTSNDIKAILILTSRIVELENRIKDLEHSLSYINN